MRLLLLVPLAAISAPAFADDTPAKVTENTVICEQSDPPLGSRIGAHRVCHTLGQWRVIKQASSEFVAAVNRANGNNTTALGGGGH